MADWNDLGLVWDQLHRVENQLKGIGLPGSRQFDSLGRLASSASHITADWALEQLGRVGRVRKALNESGPLAQRLAVDSLVGLWRPLSLGRKHRLVVDHLGAGFVLRREIFYSASFQT